MPVGDPWHRCMTTFPARCRQATLSAYVVLVAERRGNGRLAVEHGQAMTFRVIIAAALIMSSVFFSFALGDQRIIKEFGIGLGTAILADALLVRMVLVPSVMHLFGNRAWWFPGWLDRLLPNLSVEGTSEPAAAPSGGSE
jgi:RND superfamily putative drug exporter